MVRAALRATATLVVAGAALLTSAPSLQAVDGARLRERAVVTPALPPCDAFPTPPRGSATLFIPPLPGRNCTTG